MEEQELINLGFVKTIEEEDNFYYYSYDFGDSFSLSLISCSNDELDLNGKWYVEIFNDSLFKFRSIEDLRELITILQSNIKNIC